ncbi:MAG: hypothetical protein QXP36_01435 [Conexivisphaerales archaeon]
MPNKNEHTIYKVVPSIKISWDTYRRLITIQNLLSTEESNFNSLDSVISKLIDVWNERAKAQNNYKKQKP